MRIETMFVLLTAEFPWLRTMPGIVQELSRYLLNEQMNDKWYDFFSSNNSTLIHCGTPRCDTFEPISVMWEFSHRVICKHGGALDKPTIWCFRDATSSQRLEGWLPENGRGWGVTFNGFWVWLWEGEKSSVGGQWCWLYNNVDVLYDTESYT